MDTEMHMHLPEGMQQTGSDGLPRVARVRNALFQQCDEDKSCRVVSIRNALLVSDNEPMNFVNTGGGLGVQGDTDARPRNLDLLMKLLPCFGKTLGCVS